MAKENKEQYNTDELVNDITDIFNGIEKAKVPPEKAPEGTSKIGEEISEMMKGDFSENKGKDSFEESTNKKPASNHRQTQKALKKERKALEKDAKKKKKEERRNTPKRQKRKENFNKIKEFGKSFFKRISKFLTKARYFVLNGPIEYRNWLANQNKQAENYIVGEKDEKTSTYDKNQNINSQIITVAKEKGFDAIIKDNKEEQKKQIYFSGNGYEATTAINKFGQVIDSKVSAVMLAEKEDAEKINSIIQKTRGTFTTNKDYNTVLCENFQKFGYEAKLGENCIYLSNNDKNFVVRDYSRPKPEILTQSIANTLDVATTISAFSQTIRENTEKQLEKELNCSVKIGENKKGLFVEIEEKTDGKYSFETIKDLVKPETKLDIQRDDKNYQLQNKDGKLMLIEVENGKEKIYSDEKEIKNKLNEIGVLADKQVVQIDKNGNLNLTNEQLNNELCKKLESASISMSSFQDYSQQEEKNLKIKKTTEIVIKNAQNLQPGGTFEREQDGIYIKAVCGMDGSCVVNVVGRNDSSEEVSLTGNPKDVATKLEQVITKAYNEAEAQDLGDLNQDGAVFTNDYEDNRGFVNQEEIAAIDTGDDLMGAPDSMGAPGDYEF